MAEYKALVIGVSQYPNPDWELPAVTGDVREIAKLLGSKYGSFQEDNVELLTDESATKDAVIDAIKRTLKTASEDDTVFIYLAGHGSADTGTGLYYFIPYDADPYRLDTSAVRLDEVRKEFENCPSKRAFMWLDFCHSGGIIERDLKKCEDDKQLIERTLEVVKGEGKLIFAACAAEQKAAESQLLGHGLFTSSLLNGLRGEAAAQGEVTANSLFDYIDRTMGNDRQSPMQFGHMRGRVVLMHYNDVPVEKNRTQTEVGSGKVSSSGKWLMLGSSFFESQSVDENMDGEITIVMETSSAEEEAVVRRLRPDKFGQSNPIPFAHGNNGVLTTVKNLESSSSGDSQIWTVTLKPEDFEYGGARLEMAYQTNQGHHTPEDFARMRASRLLLNDPPANVDAGNMSDIERINHSMMENFIRGMNSPAEVQDCAIHMIYRSIGDKPEFLIFARLLAVYLIRCASIAEEILELSLGPVHDQVVDVKFRGRRRRKYQNVDPAIIEIEGECSLAEVG